MVVLLGNENSPKLATIGPQAFRYSHILVAAEKYQIMITLVKVQDHCMRLIFWGSRFVIYCRTSTFDVDAQVSGLSSHCFVSFFDRRYKYHALEVSERFRAQPHQPLERAVFWINHVLKHGAAHLRSRDGELSWIQYNLLDVAGALFAVCLITLWALRLCFSALSARWIALKAWYGSTISCESTSRMNITFNSMSCLALCEW